MEPMTPDPPADDWLTIEAAATLTGRTPADILEATRAGDIPGVAYSPATGWRLPRTEVLTWHTP